MSSDNSIIVEVRIGKPVCVHLFSEFKQISEIMEELALLYKINEAQYRLRWRFEGDRIIVWEEAL